MANLITRRSEPGGSLAGFMDPLGGLDPFRMIRNLMGADPFAGMVQATGAMFMPDIEIKETKDSYNLTLDLPGVREQELDVSITGNRLTVSGKREEEQREEGDRFFAYERSYGAFSRAFVLPEGVDSDQIKADLRDGVLQLSVPKRAEVQPRHVDIRKTEKQEGHGGKEQAKEPQAGQPTQKKAA